MSQKYEPFPLHPVLQHLFQESLNVSPEEVTQPAVVRKGFDQQAAALLSVPDNVLRETREITAGPHGAKVTITIIRPVGSENATLPAILFLHGGGWVFGSLNTHGSLVYELATKIPAAVIFVDYAMSPEAVFPTALEQCYAALCWTQANAATIKIDPKRIAVAGDSAGGNLTAGLSLLAKERGNQAISLQILYYPVLGTDFENESYTKYADNNMVPRETMKYVWRAYTPDPAMREDIKAVPRKATTEQLEGLPPALIVTAEYDVLRDEAEAYAKQLNKAGVDVVPVRYVGVQHGFLTVPVLDRPQARAAIAQTLECLRTAWAKDAKL